MKKKKETPIPRLENVFLEKWRPYFWILLIGTLVYIQVLSFNYIPLDDRLLIVDNHDFLSNLGNIFQAFKQDFFKIAGQQESSKIYYRPIVTLSLMIDAKIGGVSPFMYHLSNLIFHLLASCLLFVFLKKLDYTKNLALLFSLVFAVHPGLTQAVAWVLGRNDTLMTIFVLAAFISLFNLKKNKWLHYFLHLLFFTLALFTKESAVAVIFLLAFYVLFLDKEKKIHFNRIFLFGGWTIITISWFLIRNLAVESQKITVIDFLKNSILNFPVVIKYLGKIIFPFNLSGFPTVRDTTFTFGIIALALVILVLVFTKKKRYNFIFFGVSWFVLFLIPSFIAISIFPSLFEHRVYLPVIGIFIFLLETDLLKNIHKKRLLLKVGLPVILILSFAAFQHSRSFKNDFNFWKNVTGSSPHLALGHSYMGEQYLSRGLTDKAVSEYKQAVALNPSQRGAHNTLGVIYGSRQMYGEAEKEFKAELSYHPEAVDAMVNLAQLYFIRQKFKESEDLLKRSIQINPDYVKGYEALAIYYYNRGKFAEARYYVEQLRKRGVKVRAELLKALGLSGTD